MNRYWNKLFIVFIVILTASMVFVGCGADSTTAPGSENDTAVICPPENGIVIFGTEGCPHCRNLKEVSYEKFGEDNTCFVEVSSAYGGDKETQEFFTKIYKEAYPFIREDQMGVPLSFLFKEGSVKAVFIGELPLEALNSIGEFVSTSTQAIIIWEGKGYQLSATTALELTKDIKEFFQR